MMAHTPGPWTVGDLINMGGYRDYYQISCSPEHGDLNFEISNPFGTELEETKANARLIAAAPDLLAALEFMISNCPECDGDGVIYDDDYWTVGPTGGPCPICQGARSAIAAASKTFSA